MASVSWRSRVGSDSLLVSYGKIIYYDVFQCVLSSIICVVALRCACEVVHTCNPQVRGRDFCRSNKSLRDC